MEATIRRYRYPLIALAVVVVVLLVDWVAWLSPEGSKLSTLDATKASLSNQDSSLTAEITTLQNEKRLLPKNCTTLTKDLTEIPSSPDIASFYTQVTQLASISGVGTPSITYNGGTAASGSTTSSTPAPSTTGLPSGLSAISITLSITGDYGAVSAFIHGLDTFPRLYTISTIDVTGGSIVVGGQTIPPGTGSFSVDLTGSIYYDTAQHGLAALCASAAGSPTAVKG